MTSIEFYYPMVELTKKGDNTDGFYFENNLNNQINFAIKQSSTLISGKATKYYIHTIIGTPIVTDATHYFIISHISTDNSIFYVVFPLRAMTSKDIAPKLIKDRVNGGLAKSIDNLSNPSLSLNSKIKFSLESVIDSMNSFNPNAYHSYSDGKVYVIKSLIYVNDIINGSNIKYASPGAEIISSIARLKDSVEPAKITQVFRTNNCKASAKKAKKAEKTLFSGLSYKAQSKVNYMNFVMMLATLIYLLSFYHLYYNYDIFRNKETTIFTFMMIALLLITIPVGTTLLLSNKPGTKINETDLRYAVTFARYSIFAILISLFAIFSNQIFMTSGSGLLDFLKKVFSKLSVGFVDNPLKNIVFLIASIVIIVFIFIIFFKV